MNYVEWLRVRNVLRVLAIVLGVLILASLIARIAFNRYLNDDTSYLQHLQTAPGTKVTHVVLPNGIPRTIIDDPHDKTYVTIDNLGYGGRHIIITEPRSNAKHHYEHVSIGSVDVVESANGKTATTVINTNAPVPFVYYAAIADVMALVIATVLGAPFARENDGHLEFALTKPVSRVRFGLAKMGVDIAAILAASVMTVIALTICQAMFEIPHFDFSGINWHALPIGVLCPLAWYAMLAAATASLNRGYGAILGFAWPVTIVVLVLGLVNLGSSLVGQTIHAIFWVISRVIPLTYASIQAATPAVHHGTAPVHSDFALRVSIEALLFVVYAALALYQWRRVEA